MGEIQRDGNGHMDLHPWRRIQAVRFLSRSSRDQVLALIAEEQPLGGAPRAVARGVQARAKGWTTGEIYAILPRMQNSRHC